MLLPAEGLAQNPHGNRDGDEEQTQANRATPAEPGAPRAPVFQALFVAPVIVVGRFALMLWHTNPLLFNEGLSPRGVDDVRCGAGVPILAVVLLPTMSFAE